MCPRLPVRCIHNSMGVRAFKTGKATNNEVVSGMVDSTCNQDILTVWWSMDGHSRNDTKKGTVNSE